MVILMYFSILSVDDLNDFLANLYSVPEPSP